MRSVLSIPSIAVVIVASVWCLGCAGSPTTPSLSVPIPIPVATPAPTPAPSLPPSPPDMFSSTSLEIANLKLLLFRRQGSSIFQYEPRAFELVETSGKTGQSLRYIEVTAPGGYSETDCLDHQLSIGPGQRKDLRAALGYCMPYAVTRTEVSIVTIVARFVDDEGTVGDVRVTLDVSGCTLGGVPGLVNCE